MPHQFYSHCIRYACYRQIRVKRHPQRMKIQTPPLIFHIRNPCRFQMFLHCSLNSNTEEEEHQLLKEAAVARELGVGAQFLKSVPLFNRPGIEFANQAKFHP